MPANVIAVTRACWPFTSRKTIAAKIGNARSAGSRVRIRSGVSICRQSSVLSPWSSVPSPQCRRKAEVATEDCGLGTRDLPCEQHQIPNKRRHAHHHEQGVKLHEPV